MFVVSSSSFVNVQRGIHEGAVVDRVCRLCSVLKCFMFLSCLPFMAYNIIGFPGISMGLFSEHGPCLEHDHELLRPIIVSTWMPEKVGGLPGKSLVFAESQVNDFLIFSFFFFCSSTPWQVLNCNALTRASLFHDPSSFKLKRQQCCFLQWNLQVNEE